MLSYKNLGQYCLATILAFLSTATFAEISVTDDIGRSVTLKSPAKRIVSLSPHNTENLFTAGAGELIVGTVDYSDFPAKALDILRIGGYKKINVEAVLAAKPDLVVAWSSGNPTALVQRLLDFGLPVFFSEPATIESIVSNIERFSILTDTQIEAGPSLEKMRDTLASLKKQYAKQTRVKVFYQVWDQPLISLNGAHIVSNALEICGGENIFRDEPTIAPRINIESVVVSNPQLILLAGDTQEQSARWKHKWEKWPAIDAVKDDSVSYINADVVSRATQRFIEGTGQICQLIDAARRKFSQPQ